MTNLGMKLRLYMCVMVMLWCCCMQHTSGLRVGRHAITSPSTVASRSSYVSLRPLQHKNMKTVRLRPLYMSTHGHAAGTHTNSSDCLSSLAGSMPCELYDVGHHGASTTTKIGYSDKGSSPRTSSVNLLKNMVGAGVFSLNSRVMAISSNPMAILPAAALITTMAAWATYNFYMVGETCRLTDSSTYSEAWSKTVSASSQWIIQSVRAHHTLLMHLC